MELTSSSYSQSDSASNIQNAIMRKAYAVFTSQPGWWFLFVLSITNQEFRIHMFDHSGVVLSRPYNIHQSPCILLCMLSMLTFGNFGHVGYNPTFLPQYLTSWTTAMIQVESTAYDIIDQIFFNFLIRGWGTSCWHVRHKNKDYMIKDAWTHESHVNCKRDILTKIWGLKGVPQLISAWTVEIGGVDDQTDTCCSSLSCSSDIQIHCPLLMQPVEIPLSDFSSIHELLSILINILDSK